jgi:hypothetical protein
VTTQSKILQNFQAVSLDEIDSVSFMSRVDSKYLFPVNKLGQVLLNLAGDYKVLEINQQREFKYSTVYFDTAEYKFYNQHHAGKMERDKVRLRTYETNNLTYLEVKHKTNKDRTIKSRIKSDNTRPPDDARSQRFLAEKLRENSQELQPVLTSLFTRITLISKSLPERVTIDFNIAYTGNDGRRIDLPNIAVAEIKREKALGNSVLHSTLKKMGIRQTGFSKYCLGAAMLDGVKRKNNVKPILLQLNKINDESTKHDVA